MIEGRGGERLAAQTLARDGVTLGRGRQQFDRDASLEPRVFGEEHFAHPAGPKWREDAVAAGEQWGGHETGESISGPPVIRLASL